MTVFATLLRRYFGPYHADTTDWNIRYLYLEIFFASFLGGIANFNVAFAVRLGASDSLVAWLNAAPALLSAIASIPSARFLATRSNRRIWMFGSLFLNRLGYLIVAFIPFLFPFQSAAAFVIWIVALSLPAIFFSNGWSALLGELIPERRRAFVIARRSIINSAAVVVVSALVGVWLDAVMFPANYEMMYVFGFVTVLGSQFFLGRLSFRNQSETQIIRKEKLFKQQDEVAHQPLKITPSMRNMLINSTVYTFALNIPSSLFTIYYIQRLRVTDGWIGLLNAGANLGVIVGYIVWENLLRRHPYTWAQRRGTLLTWIFPVVAGLSPNLTLIMIFNVLVNCMHPGVDLSSFNIMLKQTRPEQRTQFISWYTAVTQLAVFIGPLFGAWLVGYIDITTVIVLSGILRLVGGIMFNVFKVDEELEEPALAPQNS